MTWQPIETAPKEVEVLVFMPDASEISGRIHRAIQRKNTSGHTWFIGHHFGFDCEPPSHWQPLPDPPETGQ